MPACVSRVIYGALAVSLCTLTTTSAETWHEVLSPNFIVVSNAGEGESKRVARNLERIRVIFQRAVPGTREQRRRLQVLAVKHEGDLKQLLPEFWARKNSIRPGGLFRVNANGPSVALVAGAGYGLETVYHEFFHYLTSLNAPGLPPWLNEGLAAYWANIEIRDDEIIVGRPSSGYVAEMRRSSLLPLEEFLRSSPGSVTRRQVPLYYAEAWGLTHYLMIDDRGARREELSQYVALVRNGEDVVGAARRAFGDLGKLEKELWLYSRQRRFDVFHQPADTSIDGIRLETRELEEADSLALRGRFVVDGGLPEEAEPLLKEALKKAPNHPLALEGMGVLAARRGDRKSEEDWFRRAASTEGASAFAHYRLGLMQPNGEPKERNLLRAIELDPNLTSAYVALAYYYGGTDSTLERSLSYTREASARDPGNAEYQLLGARILRKMGSAKEATEVAAGAARLAIWSNHGAACNNVCWYGSLTGFAAQVMEACEAAVHHSPDSFGGRDSRGLARAITGDYRGAIEDFRSVVEESKGRSELKQKIEQRREWIGLLEQGKSPFDDESLAALLSAPF